MNEIYSETPYRMAHERHRNLLQESESARLIEKARSPKPEAWDYIALRLGNWLIDLGCSLKSHSALARLSQERT